MFFELRPISVKGKISNEQLTSISISASGCSLVSSYFTTVSTAVSSSTTLSTLLAIFAYKNGSSVQDGVLKLACSTCSIARILEYDNTTSLRSSTLLIKNTRLGNVSSLTHVVLQILPAGFIGKVSNKHGSSSTSTGFSIMLSSFSSSSTTGSPSSILTNKDHAPLHLGIAQSITCLFRFFRSRILYNSATLRTPISHSHDLGISDISSIPHVLFQVLGRYLPRQVSNINPAGLLLVVSSATNMVSSGNAAIFFYGFEIQRHYFLLRVRAGGLHVLM
mmetsp:Transcript_27540/g.40783  ORF Transcript_27540/g.40783 Transcript_27540/m.40783 type:complete len:277 (+) Transcript_27540:322-1152(+)